ncbi:hypothetical protein [Gorillibacterium massiliense]|nr:hypothetical protein [Gorillibacterium massiliense]
MKDVMTKLLLIALALACLSAIAFPAVWKDGAKVKNRVTYEYEEMFN